MESALEPWGGFVNRKERQTPSSTAGISVSVGKRGGGPQKRKKEEISSGLCFQLLPDKDEGVPQASGFPALCSSLHSGPTRDQAPKAAEWAPADAPCCESRLGDLTWRQGRPVPAGPRLCPEPSAEGPWREPPSKQQFPHNRHRSLNVNTVHLLARECAHPGEHRKSSQPLPSLLCSYNPGGAPSELPTTPAPELGVAHR